eukprot:1651999-Rhodomonas_salina.4
MWIFDVSLPGNGWTDLTNALAAELSEALRWSALDSACSGSPEREQCCPVWRLWRYSSVTLVGVLVRATSDMVLLETAFNLKDFWTLNTNDLKAGWQEHQVSSLAPVKRETPGCAIVGSHLYIYGGLANIQQSFGTLIFVRPGRVLGHDPGL